MVRPFFRRLAHAAGWLPALLIVAGVPASAAGQPAPAGISPVHPRTERVVRAGLAASPITLDGRLDEAAWDSAELATGFVQSEPVEGQPLSERTVVRVLVDREYLYIGAYCFDSDPSGIIINELKRDFDSQEGDAFGVAIDVMHDRRNSFSFFTNPGSAKRDAQSLSDGRYTTVDWDGVWEVVSAVHDNGWVAEMAIPFKTLGVKSREIDTVGINFKRRIRRKNEEGYWSPVPRRFTINYVSLAGTLAGLGQVSGGGALRLKPYVTADMRSRGAAPADKAKFGVDGRYRLSAGLTIDLTYNTDFSHVESDTQQVNLTRFNLFFPEKREFFLENADIFAFGDIRGERSPMGRAEDTQLFYSRRIGLSPSGEPLPLNGGVRLSGRADRWSLGLLTIHQEQTAVSPANLFTVARVRRDLFTSSDVGAIYVSREGQGSRDYNRSYGADVNLRLGTRWTANGFWAVTDAPGLTGNNSQKKISSEWDDGFLHTQMIFADIGENFRPEVGFVPRTGVRNYHGNAGIRPRPGAAGWVREWHPHVNWKVFTDRANRLLTRDQHYALQVSFRDGSDLEVSTNPQLDTLEIPFAIRPHVVIPAGQYTWHEWRLRYNTNRSKLLSGSINLTTGGFFGGERTTMVLNGTVLMKPRLSTSFSYERNDLTLPWGRVRADLYILRGLYSVSPRMFVDALVQYQAETNRVFTTARFNFTYRPLSDFAIVVNENRWTDRLVGQQPVRALVIKYTRLLQF